MKQPLAKPWVRLVIVLGVLLIAIAGYLSLTDFYKELGEGQSLSQAWIDSTPSFGDLTFLSINVPGMVQGTQGGTTTCSMTDQAILPTPPTLLSWPVRYVGGTHTGSACDTPDAIVFNLAQFAIAIIILGGAVIYLRRRKH